MFTWKAPGCRMGGKSGGMLCAMLCPASCGGYFDTSHLNDIFTENVYPVMEAIFPGVLASFRRITHPATVKKITTMRMRSPPNCPDLNPIEHLGIMDSVCQWGRAVAKGEPIWYYGWSVCTFMGIKLHEKHKKALIYLILAVKQLVYSISSSSAFLSTIP